MDPRDKVALITGAGYGIGRGIALRLAAAGASVVVDDIRDEHGRETVAMIEEAGGRASYVHADIVKEDDVARMIAFAGETFGGPDILVNNAGSYYDPPYYPEADPVNWQRILDIFLRAYMSVTGAAIEVMRGAAGGVIVNISSAAGVGFAADNGWPDYAAAKAAVMRLTATLAPFRERMNVRVNCICPGWVATENVRAYTSKMTPKERREADVPAGGPNAMLQPTDIGEAVLHFVRDESLAGRVMLYYEPGKRRLIPVDLDLFEQGEEMPDW